MENMLSYISVVNKETYRRNGKLYHKMILNQASSVLINEMIKHDKTKRKSKIISNKVTKHSNVSRVAKRMLLN